MTRTMALVVVKKKKLDFLEFGTKKKNGKEKKHRWGKRKPKEWGWTNLQNEIHDCCFSESWSFITWITPNTQNTTLKKKIKGK